MGLRLRKSINLGGGFRINISKSGVGYSWGVRGARFTKTARKAKRTTLSIPGTGISYVQQTSQRKPRRPHLPPEKGNRSSRATDDTNREVVDVKRYQAAEHKDLLRAIQKVRHLNLLSTLLLCTFLLAEKPVFILTSIIGLVLKIYVRKKLAITLDYEFDQAAGMAYSNLNATWMSLNHNEKFWQIISSSQANKKTSGGASRSVSRIASKAIGKTPYYIKPNLEIFGLQLRKQKLFFLPDKLLIVSRFKVGAVNYSELRMGLGTSHFVETETVPKDAKIVGQTWLKVNKNGTPDKRFKNNRQVPVCEYGKISVTSNNVLHVELMCSNSSTVEKMQMHARQAFHRQ